MTLIPVIDDSFRDLDDDEVCCERAPTAGELDQVGRMAGIIRHARAGDEGGEGQGVTVDKRRQRS